MQQTIDVRRELDEAPVSAFHWILAALALVVTIFDGYDTVSPSYVIHYVAKPWHLTPGQAGFLVSSGLIGFAVGSVVHGVVADRIGRKPTLIAGLFVAGVFSLLTGLLARSFASFVALRLLTGLGLGVLLPLGTAYINEYVPRRVRNRLSMSAGAGFSAGAVICSLVGVLLTPIASWEVLYWLAALSIPVGAIYLWVFPESPEYLIACGRSAEVPSLLSRAWPARAASYQGAKFSAPARNAGQDSWLPISPRFLPVTIGLWVTCFLLLFDIYGLQGWTPTLMIQRGEGFAAGFSFGAILQGMGIVGMFVCAYLADRWLGQRGAILAWCGLGALAALLVAEVNLTATNVAGIGAAGFFIIGAEGVLNNLCAMTYPVASRASGEGFMLGVGRVGGILGPTIGGVLLGAVGGTSVLFLAVAVATALAFCATAVVILTRGAAPAGGPALSPGG